MRCVFWWGVVSALFMVAADDPKQVVPKLVPDLNWRPSPGDEVTVHPSDTAGCTYSHDFNEYLKLSQAKDNVGIEKMIAAGTVGKLTAGTRVLIIKDHQPPPVYRASVSGADISRQIQQDILRGPGPEYPFEVRVVDGPFRDSVRFIARSSVRKLIPEVIIIPRPKPVPKVIDPAVRARTAIDSARNLEKAGKIAGAVRSYRQVAKDFPATDSAKVALDRIKALTSP